MEGYYKSNLQCLNCIKPFTVFVPKGVRLLEDANLKVVYYKEEENGETKLRNIKCSMCDLERGIVKSTTPDKSESEEKEVEIKPKSKLWKRNS